MEANLNPPHPAPQKSCEERAGDMTRVTSASRLLHPLSAEEATEPERALPPEATPPAFPAKASETGVARHGACSQAAPLPQNPG